MCVMLGHDLSPLHNTIIQIQLRMEAILSSETLLGTAPRHDPEGHTGQFHRRENLRSHPLLNLKD
jgi:hypothetical protein